MKWPHKDFIGISSQYSAHYMPIQCSPHETHFSNYPIEVSA